LILLILAEMAAGLTTARMGRGMGWQLVV